MIAAQGSALDALVDAVRALDCARTVDAARAAAADAYNAINAISAAERRRRGQW